MNKRAFQIGGPFYYENLSQNCVRTRNYIFINGSDIICKVLKC